MKTTTFLEKYQFWYQILSSSKKYSNQQFKNINNSTLIFFQLLFSHTYYFSQLVFTLDTYADTKKLVFTKLSLIFYTTKLLFLNLFK